jgi:AraC-like DNA-binding protein
MMICLEIADSTPRLIQTLQALILDLEHGPASLGDIANRLALSERTLRRRLRTLGTSYNKILRDVRSSTAREWLRDSTLTIESIAWRLGYTETANFRHAFKRWNGQSPQAFRRQLRCTRETRNAPAPQQSLFGNLVVALGG